MRVVEVNQLGVFLGTQAAVPALREAGGGTVVNISSVDGLIGLKYLSAYCASKFAVVGMTRVAAMELGPDGIRVNAVCPGVIRTDMTKDLHEMQVKWLHRTCLCAGSARPTRPPPSRSSSPATTPRTSPAPRSSWTAAGSPGT